MSSKAATVAEYLAKLAPDRREALRAVRRVILKNLPKGYEEDYSNATAGIMCKRPYAVTRWTGI